MMNKKDIYNIVIAKKLAGGGGGGGNYQSKIVTPDFSDGNPYVYPDTGYDALSSVVIQKDSDLIPGNVKKDINVHGIVGTLEEMSQELRTDMNAVLNEKFGTSTDYPPETWADTVELMEPYPTDTAQGAVANFKTSLTLPLVSHNVTIEPQQAGTGDPSPSNPRAISGWSAVNGSRTGKNFFDKNAKDTEKGYLDNQYLKNDGTLAGNNNYYVSEYMPVNEGESLTLSNLTGYSQSIAYYDANKNYLSANAYFNATVKTITTPADCCFIRFSVPKANADIVQIERSDTDTAYESYTGTSFTRAFLDDNDDPVTVYGGSVNLTTGEGVITWKAVVVTGEENWIRKHSQRPQIGFGATASSSPFYDFFQTGTTSTYVMSNALCSRYKGIVFTTFENEPDNTIQSYGGTFDGSSGTWVTIKDTRWENMTIDQIKAEFATWYANGNPLVIVAPINSISFHCDPLTLDTLKGVNNVWADTGDTAVEFKLTHQDWVDNHTEPNLGKSVRTMGESQEKEPEPVEEDER